MQENTRKVRINGIDVKEFRAEDISRFWSKVQSGDENECWNWMCGRLISGYGMFYLQRKNLKSHRVAWALSNNDNPGDHLVCHRCDNPRCCNPAHLFLGSHSDNIQDMLAKNRGNFASGDRHGSRTRPESRATGDRNGSRTKPECIPRGETHWSKFRPWDVARGEKHGSKTRPDRVVRGERKWSAKLTEDRVREIRRKKAHEGSSLDELAAEYNMSKTAIALLVRRKTWAHVCD